MERCDKEWGCDECTDECWLNDEGSYLDPKIYGYGYVIKNQLSILTSKVKIIIRAYIM